MANSAGQMLLYNRLGYGTPEFPEKLWAFIQSKPRGFYKDDDGKCTAALFDWAREAHGVMRELYPKMIGA